MGIKIALDSIDMTYGIYTRKRMQTSAEIGVFDFILNEITALCWLSS